MRDEIAGGSGEAGELDRVLLQLEEVAISGGGAATAGDEHVVGAKGAVPVREVVADSPDDAGEGVRPEVGGEGDEVKVSLLAVFRRERAAPEGGVEERFRRRFVGEGRVWLVDKDFQPVNHGFVVWEEFDGREIWREQVRERKGLGENADGSEESG